MNQSLPYNLILIGFMGTGKSTICRALAKRLPLREVDVDALIVRRAGKPISAIFEEEGEEVFRQLETAVLCELQQQQGLIISCGGGMAMQARNIPLMKQGKVILLTASPRTILRRVGHSTHRPLLNGHMNIKDIAALMAVRRPQYEAVADLIVSTDHKTVSMICNELITLLEMKKNKASTK